MATTNEVEVKRGLTVRVVIISLLMTVLSFVLNFWLMTRTSWSLFAGVLPLSMLYIVIINEGLGRINPRLRLSRQELAVLFVAFFAIGGCNYGMYGELKFGVAIITTYCEMLGPIRALSVDPLKSYFTDKYTPLWVPSPRLAGIAWNGLAAGQMIEWEAWAITLVFWSLWFITWTVWTYFIGFMLRRQMVEVERLPFALAAPSSYQILWATEPKESIWSIFNLKSTIAKIFWIAVVLGFFTTFTDVVRYFVPAVPASGEFTTITLDFTPITRSALPGASLTGVLVIPRVAVFALLPMDVLLSGNLAWFVLFILYPLIGVKMGLLPYSPGVESDAWYYAQNVGPLRAVYASNTGILVGIGLWALYIARSYIKGFFTSLYGALQGKEVGEDQGVKYHYISAGFILLTIILIAMPVISGVPVSVTLVMLGVWFLMNAGAIYACGNYGYLSDDHWCQGPLGFYSGAALGLWGTGMPNPSIEAARTAGFAGFLNTRYISYNGRTLISTFGTGGMNQTRAKDIFAMMILVSVASAVTAHTLSLWWVHRFGLKSLSVNLPFGGLATAYTNSAFGIPSDILVSHLVGGSVITLLLYALRLKFTWFFINPVGIAMSTFSPTWYAFPNLTIALIVRWLSIKIGGVRFWETRAVPFMIGWAGGYSVNYVIVMWITFITRALPLGP